jgi:hypothetical protein
MDNGSRIIELPVPRQKFEKRRQKTIKNVPSFSFSSSLLFRSLLSLLTVISPSSVNQQSVNQQSMTTATHARSTALTNHITGNQ